MHLLYSRTSSERNRNINQFFSLTVFLQQHAVFRTLVNVVIEKCISFLNATHWHWTLFVSHLYPCNTTDLRGVTLDAYLSKWKMNKVLCSGIVSWDQYSYRKCTEDEVISFLGPSSIGGRYKLSSYMLLFWILGICKSSFKSTSPTAFCSQIPKKLEKHVLVTFCVPKLPVTSFLHGCDTWFQWSSAGVKVK